MESYNGGKIKAEKIEIKESKNNYYKELLNKIATEYHNFKQLRLGKINFYTGVLMILCSLALVMSIGNASILVHDLIYGATATSFIAFLTTYVTSVMINDGQSDMDENKFRSKLYKTCNRITDKIYTKRFIKSHKCVDQAVFDNNEYYLQYTDLIKALGNVPMSRGENVEPKTDGELEHTKYDLYINGRLIWPLPVKNKLIRTNKYTDMGTTEISDSIDNYDLNELKYILRRQYNLCNNCQVIDEEIQEIDNRCLEANIVIPISNSSSIASKIDYLRGFNIKLKSRYIEKIISAYETMKNINEHLDRSFKPIAERVNFSVKNDEDGYSKTMKML